MDIRVVTTDDYEGVYSLWTSCKGVGLNNLVAFIINDTGNEFWKKMSFTVREDLVYRNRMLTDMIKYI